MKLFKLKKELYERLIKDAEFERDACRPYYIIRGLDYKGKKISIGIPLRSNINKKFNSKKDEFVATLPTDHTLISNGNIAGWHITKIIPIDYSLVVAYKIDQNPSLSISFEIANHYFHKDLMEKTKGMLKRFENGENVFGAIDFDWAIEIIEKMKE